MCTGASEHEPPGGDVMTADIIYEQWAVQLATFFMHAFSNITVLNVRADDRCQSNNIRDPSEKKWQFRKIFYHPK